MELNKDGATCTVRTAQAIWGPSPPPPPPPPFYKISKTRYPRPPKAWGLATVHAEPPSAMFSFRYETVLIYSVTAKVRFLNNFSPGFSTRRLCSRETKNCHKKLEQKLVPTFSRRNFSLTNHVAEFSFSRRANKFAYS